MMLMVSCLMNCRQTAIHHVVSILRQSDVAVDDIQRVFNTVVRLSNDSGRTAMTVD